MKKAKFLTTASIIAAVYVVLTLFSNMLGLASGVIQVRISESLCILPIFTTAAIPGVFLGCLISNLLCGGIFWDIIFGSLATLIGAILTYSLRKNKYIAVIPPILSNTIIIPFVLKFSYGLPGSIWYFFVTVGIGEIISCGISGIFLYNCLKKYENHIKF